jgi:hypothetical protein
MEAKKKMTYLEAECIKQVDVNYALFAVAIRSKQEANHG